MGTCLRLLIDFIFEEEEIKNQNFTKIKNKFPEKVFVIVNYLKKNFITKDSEIHKAFTNKCYK